MKSMEQFDRFKARLLLFVTILALLALPSHAAVTLCADVSTTLAGFSNPTVPGGAKQYDRFFPSAFTATVNVDVERGNPAWAATQLTATTRYKNAVGQTLSATLESTSVSMSANGSFAAATVQASLGGPDKRLTVTQFVAALKLTRVCLRLTSLVESTLAAPRLRGVRGWVSVSNSENKLTKTYGEAFSAGDGPASLCLSICKNQGGLPATIKTAAKNLEMSNKVRQVGAANGLWIGLQNIGVTDASGYNLCWLYDPTYTKASCRAAGASAAYISGTCQQAYCAEPDANGAINDFYRMQGDRPTTTDSTQLQWNDWSDPRSGCLCDAPAGSGSTYTFTSASNIAVNNLLSFQLAYDPTTSESLSRSVGTPSKTFTSSPTVSRTMAPTPSLSSTESRSRSSTKTLSSSLTIPPTPTPSITRSGSISRTQTVSLSPSKTVSVTASRSHSLTATPPATRSATRSISQSPTPSPSPSASESLTPPPTVTPPPTPTLPLTGSSSATATATILATATQSLTRSSTATVSTTLRTTATATATASTLRTETATQQPSATDSASLSALTGSATAAMTATATATASFTRGNASWAPGRVRLSALGGEATAVLVGWFFAVPEGATMNRSCYSFEFTGNLTHPDTLLVRQHVDGLLSNVSLEVSNQSTTLTLVFNGTVGAQLEGIVNASLHVDVERCIGGNPELPPLEIEFHTPPPPPPPVRFPLVLPKEFIDNTRVAAGSVSSLAGIGSPGVATQASRSAIILGILECTPQEDPLDWMQSPTGQRIITTKVGYYVAGSIFNHAVMAGLAILQVVMAVVISKRDQVTFRDACEKVRFPSLLAFFTMFTLEPTAMCCMVTMMYATDDWVFAIGFVSYGLLLLYPLATAIHMRWFFGGRFHSNWEADAGESRSPLERFFFGTSKWKDQEDGSGYCQRTRLFFCDYRGEYYWFLIVEMVVSLLCGSLDGYKQGEGRCGGVVIALLLTFVGFFVLLVALRPYNAPFLLLFAVVLTFFQALGALFMTLGLWTGSTEAVNMAQWTSLISLYLLIGRVFFDIGPKLYRAYKGVVHRGKSRARSSTTLSKAFEAPLLEVEEAANRREDVDSLLDVELPEFEPVPNDSMSLGSLLDGPDDDDFFPNDEPEDEVEEEEEFTEEALWAMLDAADDADEDAIAEVLQHLEAMEERNLLALLVERLRSQGHSAVDDLSGALEDIDTAGNLDFDWIEALLADLPGFEARVLLTKARDRRARQEEEAAKSTKSVSALDALLDELDEAEQVQSEEPQSFRMHRPTIVGKDSTLQRMFSSMHTARSAAAAEEEASNDDVVVSASTSGLQSAGALTPAAQASATFDMNALVDIDEQDDDHQHQDDDDDVVAEDDTKSPATDDVVTDRASTTQDQSVALSTGSSDDSDSIAELVPPEEEEAPDEDALLAWLAEDDDDGVADDDEHQYDEDGNPIDPNDYL